MGQQQTSPDRLEYLAKAERRKDGLVANLRLAIITHLQRQHRGNLMLRPFVPSQDHDMSRQFYEAMGFETTYADGRIAVMSNRDASFILQNFYVKELADNFVLQLTVPDANAWWKTNDPERVAEQFATKPPTPPTLQPWGMIVGFVHDPSGVLWHITEAKP